MQHLVAHPREEPMLQLCVGSVPLGVGIEVRGTIHLRTADAGTRKAPSVLLVSQKDMDPI